MSWECAPGTSLDSSLMPGLARPLCLAEKNKGGSDLMPASEGTCLPTNRVGGSYLLGDKDLLGEGDALWNGGMAPRPAWPVVTRHGQVARSTLPGSQRSEAAAFFASNQACAMASR